MLVQKCLASAKASKEIALLGPCLSTTWYSMGSEDTLGAGLGTIIARVLKNTLSHDRLAPWKDNSSYPSIAFDFTLVTKDA